MGRLDICSPFQISKSILDSCFPRQNLLAAPSVMFVLLYQTMVGVVVDSNVLLFVNPFIRLL